VAGILPLYGLAPEIVTVKKRSDLLNLIKEAQGADFPTVFLLGLGTLNQFGKDVPREIPGDTGRARVIWIGIEPGDDFAKPCRHTPENEIERALLEALGESDEPLRRLVASVDGVLRPRFNAAIISFGTLYCYDPAMDLELHLPLVEARQHLDAGDLADWLGAVVAEADEANA
jgi:hypothetical protein